MSQSNLIPLRGNESATMLEKAGNISPKDLDLIPIVDSAEEIIQIINEFYEIRARELRPNYEL